MAKKGTTGFTNQQQNALYWARRRRLEVLRGSGTPPSGPPVNTPGNLPTVPANPAVGVPQSAYLGAWTGAQPITLTQQWQLFNVSWANISGATGVTYTPVPGDVTHPLRVIVSATNSAGGPITATSAQSNAVVTAPVAPVNTVAPALSTVNVFVGIPVTVDNGTWLNVPTGYTYQWQSLSGSWANIPGATSNSYTPVTGDLSKALHCIVTASNAAGSNSAISNISNQVFDTPVLQAPVLSWTTPGTDNTPDFSAVLTSPLVADVITLQWASDSGFTSIIGTDPNTVDATEAGNAQVSFTTGQLANATYYFRSRHSRGGSDSAWSNTVTVIINALPAFDPISLPNAVGVFQANVGVFSNTLGTIPSVEGSPAIYWINRATNALHLDKSWSAPVFRQNGSSPCIEFLGDANQDSLYRSASSLGMTAAQTFSIFIAATLGSTTSRQIIGEYGAEGVNQNSQITTLGVTNIVGPVFWNGANVSGNGAPQIALTTGTPHVFGWTYDRVTSRMYLDSNTVASSAANTYYTSAMGMFGFGAPNKTVGGFAADFNVHGAVCLAGATLPSPAEIAQIITWLGALQGRII